MSAGYKRKREVEDDMKYTAELIRTKGNNLKSDSVQYENESNEAQKRSEQIEKRNEEVLSQIEQLNNVTTARSLSQLENLHELHSAFERNRFQSACAILQINTSANLANNCKRRKLIVDEAAALESKHGFSSRLSDFGAEKLQKHRVVLQTKEKAVVEEIEIANRVDIEFVKDCLKELEKKDMQAAAVREAVLEQVRGGGSIEPTTPTASVIAACCTSYTTSFVPVINKNSLGQQRKSVSSVAPVITTKDINDID